MATIDAPLDRLKQPEYTGENRCLPCTVVNSIIALIAAGIIGLVWVPAGLVALTTFAGAIYLRGYLVPGTPELTKRYFPDRALRAFGKEPPTSESETYHVDRPVEDAIGEGDVDQDDDLNGDDVEALLVDGGVVEEDPSIDDLRLTDSFQAVWWRRMRRLREDLRPLALRDPPDRGLAHEFERVESFIARIEAIVDEIQDS